MSDDRELLELAAKAAGFGYGEWTRHGIVFADRDVVWNPLTDDGDALRLAVKIGMRVYIYLGGGDDITVVATDELKGARSFSEAHADDPYAATRRAIVRAAAEIGRQR